METAPALLTFQGSPQVTSRGAPAGTSVSLNINIHAWLTAPPPPALPSMAPTEPFQPDLGDIFCFRRCCASFY